MRNALLRQRRLWTFLFIVALVVPLAAGVDTRRVEAQAVASADGMVCTTGTSPNPTFSLTTRTGYILTPDANVIYMWGLSADANPFQHPSPVLCVNEGDTVTVIVHNTLPADISLIFPGQESVMANGVLAQPQFDGGGGLTSLTDVAPANGGSITYSFVATHPGTFLYESGTDPDMQVPMGLFGALIVRPAAGRYFVYNDSGMPAGDNSEFNHAPEGEILILQSEIDPYLNQAVEAWVDQGVPLTYNPANYHPRYWLFNGRGFPDTLAPNFASWLPAQPYGALAHIQPNDELIFDSANPQGLPNPSPMNPLYYLERFINVSGQPLPFHPHGRNADVIGRDAQPVRGAGGQDLSYETFALTASPGQTYDALFHYHDREGYDPSTNPIPVTDPGWQDLTYGMYYSGSPYLGSTGPMPPGMQMVNECGEYYVIAHNHALHQLTSFGVVMTGPSTFLRVDPPGGCTPMPMP